MVVDILLGVISHIVDPEGLLQADRNQSYSDNGKILDSLLRATLPELQSPPPFRCEAERWNRERE